MTHAAMLDSAKMLMLVGAPAARALILAAAAALALRTLRVRATSAVLVSWTAVLYACLAMPLLGWILPAISVPIPAFFREAAHNSGVSQLSSAPSSAVAMERAADRRVTVGTVPADSTHRQWVSSSPAITKPVAPTLSASAWRTIPWSAFALGIYVAVALFLVARFLAGLSLSRRLVRFSQAIRDTRVTTRIFALGQELGLAYAPRVGESELVSVPLTVGVVCPAILLPTEWREWDDARLDAVLAHELSHVVRQDALTQRVSLLHRAIFWFSPLAWWLDRHLAELAEQASDEAALSCGADRSQYAQTLLGFFESLQISSGRARWVGVSMAKPGRAEQRLEKILAWKGAVPMHLKKPFIIAIIAVAIPAACLAASVRPADASGVVEPAQNQTAPAAPTTISPTTAPPPAATAPDPLLAPGSASDLAVPPAPSSPLVTGVVSKGGSVLVPPVAPVAPVAAIAPPPRAYGRGFSYAYDYDDEQRFVIVTGNTDSLTMSGSSEDAHHVEKLRKRIAGNFIWFERDEKSYIIRDQATVERARQLWAPQEELGKKQEALGKQQEALGKQQEALGKKMEQVQVKVPDMSAELERLKAEIKELGGGATQDQLGRLQSEIGELQSRLGDMQSRAGDQQSKLGEEMSALGEQQGKLGEQQGELGRQQGELAERANRQMKQLLDEAIKNGTAKPEAETEGSGTL